MYITYLIMVTSLFSSMPSLWISFHFLTVTLVHPCACVYMRVSMNMCMHVHVGMCACVAARSQLSFLFSEAGSFTWSWDSSFQVDYTTMPSFLHWCHTHFFMFTDGAVALAPPFFFLLFIIFIYDDRNHFKNVQEESESWRRELT